MAEFLAFWLKQQLAGGTALHCIVTFVSRYIEDCVTKEEALALLRKSVGEKKIREEYLAAEGK